MIKRLELITDFWYLAFLSWIFVIGLAVGLQSKPAGHTQVTEKCVDGRVLIKFGDRKALEIHPTKRELLECD